LHIEVRGVAALDAVHLVRRLQRDEAVRLFEWQRPDSHRVDHAEDRAVHPDTHGQAEDGERRKARAFHERSEGVPQILEQGVHP